MHIGLFFVSLLLILFGWFTGKYPFEMWELTEKWKYAAGSRPSHSYLDYQKLISLLVLVIGLVGLFVSIWAV